MSRAETERRYVRQPKPESKLGLSTTRMYWAYDKNGHNKGQVKLSADSKKRYEGMGWTFKAVFR